MTLRLLLYANLLTASLLAGCANIQDFTASPRTACPGEPVLVSWDVRLGDTKLEANPQLDDIGPKPQQGQQSFSPAANTRFTLKAGALLKPDQREVDVVIVPSSYATSFGGVARCEQGLPTVSFVLSNTVSAQSRAVVVRNPYTRPLLVAKDGIEVELAAKAETDRFKNTALVGAWIIRARVAQGETCDTALRDVGDRLLFRSQLTCAGK